MENNIKVSIIMPAYNSELFIYDAIQSVVNQTFTNWELIICDDSSQDSTVDIIKTFDDDRIILIEKTNNEGVSLARNSCLEKATGKYLAFLDSDDIWMESKLSDQINFMIRNQFDFTCTSYGIMRDNIMTKKIFLSKKKLSYTGYLKDTSIGNSTVMLNRENINNFKIADGPLEDVATWLSILKQGKLCYGLDKMLTIYRVSEGSVSSDKVQNAKRYFELLIDREQLPVLKAIYYEANYGFNALKKRIF